jgi:hypothetical protein
MTGQRPRDEPEDFGEGHPLEVVLHQLWTRREAEALRGGDVDPHQLDRNRHRAHGYEQAIAARHEARLKERGSAAGDHLPACLDRHHTSTQVRRLRTGEPGLQPSQPHLDLCRGAHAGVGGRPAWCGAGRVGEQDHGHPVRWDRRSHKDRPLPGSPRAMSGDTWTHTPRVWATTDANHHSGAGLKGGSRDPVHRGSTPLPMWTPAPPPARDTPSAISGAMSPRGVAQATSSAAPAAPEPHHRTSRPIGRRTPRAHR